MKKCEQERRNSNDRRNEPRHNFGKDSNDRRKGTSND